MNDYMKILVFKTSGGWYCCEVTVGNQVDGQRKFASHTQEFSNIIEAVEHGRDMVSSIIESN